jgi:hypothetical protein
LDVLGIDEQSKFKGKLSGREKRNRRSNIRCVVALWHFAQTPRWKKAISFLSVQITGPVAGFKEFGKLGDL